MPTLAARKVRTNDRVLRKNQFLAAYPVTAISTREAEAAKGTHKLRGLCPGSALVPKDFYGALKRHTRGHRNTCLAAQAGAIRLPD
jgi:hypothetical protein